MWVSLASDTGSKHLAARENCFACLLPAWRLDAAGEGLPARTGAVKRRCADIIVLCAPWSECVYTPLSE